MSDSKVIDLATERKARELVPVSENAPGETVETLSRAINASLAEIAPLPLQRFEPGIYPGMTYAQYARIDAINHSRLERLRRSPAHLRLAETNPPEPTAAFDFGHGFHPAVLEPERFAREFVRGLEGVKKQSKADKDAWAKFRLEHPGQTVLDAPDYDAIVGMATAVWESMTAAELLRGDGGNEVVFVWRDEQTGLMCKARIDRLTTLYGWSYVVDLKSTRDASAASFRKDVANFGYARQIAMYLDGANALAPAERRNALVAVEKDRPYGVAIYELTDSSITEARRQYRRHLEIYAECLTTKAWPSYRDEIIPLSLPGWAFENEEA